MTPRNFLTEEEIEHYRSNGGPEHTISLWPLAVGLALVLGTAIELMVVVVFR